MTEKNNARVVAVCISEEKGTRKHEVPIIEVKEDYGIVGDAHAGKWHRQVSLLNKDSVDKLQSKIDFKLKPGDFAENILVSGIVLYELPIGTRLKIGDIEGEVTQIGKECHQDCMIRKLTGDCVMPREGIFVRIIKGGHGRNAWR